MVLEIWKIVVRDFFVQFLGKDSDAVLESCEVEACPPLWDVGGVDQGKDPIPGADD